MELFRDMPPALYFLSNSPKKKKQKKNKKKNEATEHSLNADFYQGK